MEKHSRKANNDDEECVKVPQAHFGHLIKAEIERQGRRMAWFAKQMNYDRSNLYKVLERSHLDTYFVLRSSVVLQHDFFADASAMLHSVKEPSF